MTNCDHDYDPKAGHSVPPEPAVDRRYSEPTLKGAAALEADLKSAAMLIILLARRLPKEDERRRQALDWLVDRDLMPEVMRMFGL